MAHTRGPERANADGSEPAQARALPDGRRRLRRLRAALLACGGLAGCGEPPPSPPAPPTPPSVTAPAERPVPPIPETATAAEVSDVLRAALAEGGDLRAAIPALRRIVDAHDGWVTDARLGLVRVETYAGVAAQRAADAARAAVEGPTPDAARAEAWLDLGAGALGAADAGDAPESVALARARAWVGLAGPPFRPERLGQTGVTSSGAWVLVVADDFELGEPVLPGVLKRWAKGAPVRVVARLTGHVRAGMRREPADGTAELASIAKRVAGFGGSMSGSLRATDDVLDATGLPPGAAVFLVGPGPSLVARCAGFALDPRVLDEAVRRRFPDVPPMPR